jgi:hypothetical protein
MYYKKSGQLSSKVGESSKIPDMSGFPRPSLMSGRVLEESRNILIQTQEFPFRVRRLLHGKFVSGADARRDYPEDRKIHGPFRVGGR